MAGREQSLQSDNLSPQPSTSGYPLEVTVIQVNPGPSGEETGHRDLTEVPIKEEGVRRVRRVRVKERGDSESQGLEETTGAGDK